MPIKVRASPLSTWFAWITTVAKAKTAPSKAPTSTAKTSDWTKSPLERLSITTAVTAPIAIMPSTPMLYMPVSSAISSPRAGRVITTPETMAIWMMNRMTLMVSI